MVDIHIGTSLNTSFIWISYVDIDVYPWFDDVNQSPSHRPRPWENTLPLPHGFTNRRGLMVPFPKKSGKSTCALGVPVPKTRQAQTERSFGFS